MLLAVTALATGYFYYRVGGSPFRLTYVIDSQLYNPVPFFLWQQPGPLPPYNHETLRQFYELDLQRWVEHRAQFLDSPSTALTTALMLAFIVVVNPWPFPWYYLSPVVLAATLPRGRTGFMLRLLSLGIGATTMLLYAKLMASP